MKHALTDSQVKAAKPKETPYKLTDGGRLYLLVTAAGSKLWRWNYRLNGRDSTYAIGGYPLVSLAEAREKRDAASKVVEQGVHPVQHKKTEKQKQLAETANTFRAVAEDWISHNQAGWSPYYLKQVKSFLSRYFLDTEIGDQPIRQVTAADIRGVLVGVAKRSERKGVERRDAAPTVAILLRQWCSAIFCHAVAFGKADTDPTYALRGVIKRPKVKNNKALSTAEIRHLLHALESFSGLRTTGIAIDLLMLTFVRTVELRMATWQEFDLVTATWTIPAERMKIKDGGDHVVPLSAHVLALLKELKVINGQPIGNVPQWLFPNSRRPDDCMSATTINRVLERLGFNGKETIGFSAHGFRGTASTLLHEQGFRPEVIEAQLAHKEGNMVKAAYNKAKYMPERTAMMEQWATFISSLKTSANIMPIKATQ